VVHLALAEAQVRQEHQVQEVLQEHQVQVVHQELVEAQAHQELVDQVVPQEHQVHQVHHLFGKVIGIVELHIRLVMLFITMEVLIFQ
jgi:hypothetical protein